MFSNFFVKRKNHSLFEGLSMVKKKGGGYLIPKSNSMVLINIGQKSRKTQNIYLGIRL